MKAAAIIFEIPYPVFATTPLELHLARRDGSTLEQLALHNWLEMVRLSAQGKLLSQSWDLLAEANEALAERLDVGTGGTLGNLVQVAHIDVGKLGP